MEIDNSHKVGAKNNSTTFGGRQSCFYKSLNMDGEFLMICSACISLWRITRRKVFSSNTIFAAFREHTI